MEPPAPSSGASGTTRTADGGSSDGTARDHRCSMPTAAAAEGAHAGATHAPAERVVPAAAVAPAAAEQADDEETENAIVCNSCPATPTDITSTCAACMRSVLLRHHVLVLLRAYTSCTSAAD